MNSSFDIFLIKHKQNKGGQGGNHQVCSVRANEIKADADAREKP